MRTDFHNDEMREAHIRIERKARLAAAGLAAAAFSALVVSVPLAPLLAVAEWSLEARLALGAVVAAIGASAVCCFNAGAAMTAPSPGVQRHRDARAAEAVKQIEETKRMAARAGEGNKEC